MQILYQSNCKSTRNALDTKPWKGCENRDSTAAKSMKISRVIAGGVILFFDNDISNQEASVASVCVKWRVLRPAERRFNVGNYFVLKASIFGGITVVFSRKNVSMLGTSSSYWKLTCHKGIHFGRLSFQQKHTSMLKMYCVPAKDGFNAMNLPP